MVSRVARHGLRLDAGAVQVAVLPKLIGPVDVSLGAGGDLAIHETPVFVGRL